jgi:hypothetical protein
MASSWKVVGSYFESCSCEAACPCVFTSAPTDGKCALLLAFHIDEGSLGDVNLADLNTAIAIECPGHMLQEKWKLALYLDERADERQRDALTQIFSGQAGGHLATLGPLIGEVLGVKTARIEYHAEGRRRSMRLGEIAEAEIEGLPGADGGEVPLANLPFRVVPDVALIAAKSTRVRFDDYGLHWEFSNKNGFYAPFTYQSA